MLYRKLSQEGGEVHSLQTKLFRKTAVYPNMPITKLKSKVVSQRECDHTSAKSSVQTMAHVGTRHDK